MLIPVITWFFVFKILPIYGIQLAFKDFNPLKGVWNSPSVGWKNFIQLFSSYYFSRILVNTLTISFLRIFTVMPIAIIFALLLNELRNLLFKRVTQTISYLPYFISWVTAAGLFSMLLSPQYGAVNAAIKAFGGDPIYFLGEPSWFVPVLIVSGIWKSMGWESILYLATLASIPAELYEAATIDGASRFQRVRFISFPHLVPTIVMLFIINLGYVLSAGFDQIVNMYNPAVYSVADIIDTYVYREGFENARYGFSTAVGLFKSVVGFILVMVSNKMSKKVVGKSLW